MGKEEGSSPGNQVAGCSPTEGLFPPTASFISARLVTKFLGNGGQVCLLSLSLSMGKVYIYILSMLWGLPPGLRPGTQAKAAHSHRGTAWRFTYPVGCKTRISSSLGREAPRRGLRAVQTGPDAPQTLRSNAVARGLHGLI